MIVKLNGLYSVKCDVCGILAGLEPEILDARRAAHFSRPPWWQPDWHTAAWDTEDLCPTCVEEGE